MEYKDAFVVPAPGPLVDERIATSLAQAGFAPVKGQLGRYKRGSLFSASFSFSPLKAPITVSVTTASQNSDSMQISLTYDVYTKGAIVSDRDRATWQADLESLKQSILTGDLSAGGAKQEAARAVGMAWRAFLLWFGVWLVAGILIAIGGSLLTGKQSFVTIGIVVGGILGFYVMQRYSGTTRG